MPLRTSNSVGLRLESACQSGPINYVLSAAMNIVMACAGIGVSLLVTSDPRFQTPHVYSLLALLFASAGIGSATGSIYIARLSDHVGRRPMILVSLTGLVVTTLLLGSVVAWWQLYLVITVHGCLLGVFWPCLEARITDGVDGREMTRRLGIFGIAISIGLLPGPAIGGYLSDLWLRAPFYGASSFTAILLAFLVATFRREETHDGHHTEPLSETDQDATAMEPSVQRAFLISAWTANATTCAAALILRGIFPRFAKLPTAEGGLGLTGFEAGAIIATISLSMLLMFGVLGRYHFWHYRLRYLLLGQLAAMLGCLLFAVSWSKPVFVGGALLYGLGAVSAYLSSIYYSLHGQTARAVQSGRHEAIMRVGFVTGMLITAALMWHSGSHRTPYWICVLVLLGGIFAVACVVTLARRKDRGGPGRFPARQIQTRLTKRRTKSPLQNA